MLGMRSQKSGPLHSRRNPQCALRAEPLSFLQFSLARGCRDLGPACSAEPALPSAPCSQDHMVCPPGLSGGAHLMILNPKMSASLFIYLFAPHQKVTITVSRMFGGFSLQPATSSNHECHANRRPQNRVHPRTDNTRVLRTICLTVQRCVALVYVAEYLTM